MAVKTNSVDMINGPLWRKILKFAALYMLTAFLQHLYSAADVLVVGRFAGQEALAGVGTCTTLVNLLLNFILGLSAGATIVLGQALGAKDNDDISRVVHTSMTMAIYCGFVVTVVCLLFTKQLLNIIDVPENVMSEASDYLRIVSIGYIPSLIYNFGAAILRAKGDTKRALYIITISGVINVVFNLFCVCVLKMKASGVATATVISQIFTAVCIMYILCHQPDETRLYMRKIRIYKEPFLKILKYGVPSGIQSSVYSISNVLVQSSINGFGSAAIAGSSATSSITDFYSVMVNSIYQATMVFVSQNYGAKKFDRIKKVMLIGATYVFALWVIQALITMLLGKFLLGLYVNNDLDVIEMGWCKFSVMGYWYGLMGIMNLFCAGLRGMGASFLNMLTSIVGVCGIRIIWILTAFKAIGTIQSLYACYPLSWGGTVLLHSIMYIVVFKKERQKANIKSTQIQTTA